MAVERGVRSTVLSRRVRARSSQRSAFRPHPHEIGRCTAAHEALADQWRMRPGGAQETQRAAPGRGSKEEVMLVRDENASAGLRIGEQHMPLAQQAFPPDAIAVIYRPARSAMTSGKANTRRWKLCFEQRASSFIEPLMGWTGGTDTLSQAELDFPSAEAAIAYVRRQGLNFVVQGLAEATQARCPMADKPKPGDSDRPAAKVLNRDPCTRKLEWVERTLGVRAADDRIDLDRALANPAAAFDDPRRVVRHPQL